MGMGLQPIFTTTVTSLGDCYKALGKDRQTHLKKNGYLLIQMECGITFTVSVVGSFKIGHFIIIK